MKIISIILIAISFIFAAETITIAKGGCSLRDNKIYSQSKKIGRLEEGEIHRILSTYSDWVNVKIVSGSDNAGKKGWLWTEGVDVEKLVVIYPDGLSLRATPEKTKDNSNRIGSVKKDAVIEVIDYPIQVVEIEGGWVFVGNNILK